MAAHGDPQPAFGAAETALRQALALRGGKSADSLYALAELRRRRAEWRITRKLAIGSDVRDGLELIARALEQNAQFALGDAEEGALHLVAARSAHGAAERIAAAERARAALDKALATNANLAHEFGPLRAEADRLAQK